MKVLEYINQLNEIKGKTIGVVYIFEGDDNNHYNHYDPWRSDVIADWIVAIQKLNCMPLILDVKTFIQKAVNNSLPHIDYIVNLNAGTNSLSTLAIVPSTADFIGVPCIPSDASSIIIGENKHISNVLASNVGFKVPDICLSSDSSGIFRPNNLGSSKGVQKGFPKENKYSSFLYQEFVKGFDMTIPIAYNPVSERLEILTPIAYIPNSKDINWFLGYEEKLTHQSYYKNKVKVNKDSQEVLLKLANEFNVKTYCRIDTRVRCESNKELDLLLNNSISLEEINFIEINTLPTIKNNINFADSYRAAQDDSLWKEAIHTYQNCFDTDSFVGFILANSIIALSKAKH